MISTLAFRNLFHDRIRLIVTLVGILFSIVLVAIQLGLYIGATRIIVGMIEHSDADLWITAQGAKSFEEAGYLTGRERYTVLSTPGVASAEPLLVYFANWRKPEGGSALIVVVGTDPTRGALRPWNMIEGSHATVEAPEGVAVDRTYLESLGVKGVGDTAQIESTRVRVTAMTDAIRSFTLAPYVFTTLGRARTIAEAASDQTSFLQVKLAAGADVETVREQIRSRVSGVDVLTKAEFRQRSLDHWLFSTGAGVALIGGAILGIIVGTVIVAQTLYSSTKDNINEFATLRAMGSSGIYIHKVIVCQALLSAVMGFSLAAGIGAIVVYMTADSALPIIMTPALTLILFLLTVFMCVVSAIAAIVQVMRIDPAMVFTR